MDSLTFLAAMSSSRRQGCEGQGRRLFYSRTSNHSLPVHMQILTLGRQKVLLVVGHNFVFLKLEEEELA